MPAIRNLIRLAPLSLLCSALLFTLAERVAAQTPKTCTLTVHVTEIQNANGNLLVALRRDANTVVETRTIEIDPKSLAAQTVFQNLPEGSYGVAVIHDENKNGKLDFNEMGMPIEGYGHSNNPAKRPGPPNFDETKFQITAPRTSIEVKLIYWP
jgi:uncharacterized protein (DUF2141 family)